MSNKKINSVKLSSYGSDVIDFFALFRPISAQGQVFRSPLESPQRDKAFCDKLSRSLSACHMTGSNNAIL